MPPAREDWHLDKKTIIGIITFCVGLAITFITQTVYLTSYFTTTVERFDARITAIEKSDGSQQSHENRITILEQQFGYIRADLAEIKTLLRRQVPTDNQP